MFGFIYAMSMLVSDIGARIIRGKANYEGKQRALNRQMEGRNRTNTYFDWEGRERDLDTNKKVMTYWDSGHLMLKEVGGPILRDITEEEEEVVIAQRRANKSGEKTLPYHDSGWLREQLMKVNAGKPEYARIKSPSNEYETPYDPMGKMPYLEKHVMTGRLCFSYHSAFDKNSVIKKSLAQIIKELYQDDIKGEDIELGNADCYLDFRTGEILELYSILCKEVNEYACLSYIPKKEMEEWERADVRTRSEYPSWRKLTEMQTREVINVYNTYVKSGKIKPVISGWREILRMSGAI